MKNAFMESLTSCDGHTCKTKVLRFMLLKSCKNISHIICFISYHSSCDKLDLHILLSSSRKNQQVIKEILKLIAFAILSPPASVSYLSIH